MEVIPILHLCKTCKHCSKDLMEQPCYSCTFDRPHISKWERQEKT